MHIDDLSYKRGYDIRQYHTVISHLQFLFLVASDMT